MLEWLLELDRTFFLAINGAFSSFWDPVMIFVSRIPVWIPLYVIVAAALFYKRSWKIALLAFGCAILTFVLTDQIGLLIKNLAERPRPGFDPMLEGLGRFIDGKGGHFSFVSNHASNVFGFALFTLLFFKNRIYTIAILLWAATISYSRVYLGKHFPLDILCGTILGVLCGILIYKLFTCLINKFRQLLTLNT